MQRDLRWTTAACAQLLRRQEQQRPDMMALEAMHDTALIRYGRCFKEGRRHAFHIPAAWIAELPARLRQAHARALALRDKHIAHSVNDWELNVPVAQLVTEKGSGTTTVRAVHVSQMRVLMVGTDELETLWQLAKILADRVDAEGGSQG